LIKIKTFPDKCSGCHLCEMACSIHHFGVVNINRSAIKVKKEDLTNGACEPVLCRQCKKMICMESNDHDFSDYQNQFSWDKSFMDSCPFESIFLFKEELYHCDLCGGSPKCVEVCSTGAIELRIKE